MIVRAKRSRSGRLYRVDPSNIRGYAARLVPLGDDVQASRSEKTGKWQGGVRSRLVTAEDLANAYEIVTPRGKVAVVEDARVSVEGAA